jgi:hypothetical protein
MSAATVARAIAAAIRAPLFFVDLDDLRATLELRTLRRR